ncbi:hypothetical protein J6590_050242 [Homalodisca vitripennis]|nr:hypothetical protein J6590_050242 [Homalodisca vitripennis]
MEFRAPVNEEGDLAAVPGISLRDDVKTRLSAESLTPRRDVPTRSVPESWNKTISISFVGPL